MPTSKRLVEVSNNIDELQSAQKGFCLRNGKKTESVRVCARALLYFSECVCVCSGRSGQTLLVQS